mmetsp:Transcript_94250/g.282604  ORF Transcript_94250/g.282604 Transcript_94250/m.282604 type:complete len:228 (-) Transcript_94250:1574-2257(-)
MKIRFEMPDIGIPRDKIKELKQATDSNAASNRALIENAHTVFLGGGTPAALVRRMEALGELRTLLRQRIVTGRVKLMAVSAGVVCSGPTLSTANDAAQYGKPALSLVPFHIQPHWEGGSEMELERRDQIMERHGSVLSLDNDAWCIVEGDLVRVEGERKRASGLEWRNIGREPPPNGALPPPANPSTVGSNFIASPSTAGVQADAARRSDGPAAPRQEVHGGRVQTV